MYAPSWMGGAPRRVLVATDLSARSDRALDRAVALAAQWRAELVALHVLEELDQPRRPAPLDPDAAPERLALHEAARRRLERDLGPGAEVGKLLIGEGDAADQILRVAEAEGCDIIVVGLSRGGAPGFSVLGKTVEQLIRRSPAPVLVVRTRPRGPYQHIVVATDFSPSSRHGLEAAARFFSRQPLTAFHAFEPPMANLSVPGAAAEAAYAAGPEEEWATFLQGVATPHDDWSPPDLKLEHGVPARRLSDYALAEDVDLVVMGSHGRSAVFEVLLGSVAKQIIDWLPCDALVVRQPR